MSKTRNLFYDKMLAGEGRMNYFWGAIIPVALFIGLIRPFIKDIYINIFLFYAQIVAFSFQTFCFVKVLLEKQ